MDQRCAARTREAAESLSVRHPDPFRARSASVACQSLLLTASSSWMVRLPAGLFLRDKCPPEGLTCPVDHAIEQFSQPRGHPDQARAGVLRVLEFLKMAVGDGLAHIFHGRLQAHALYQL